MTAGHRARWSGHSHRRGRPDGPDPKLRRTGRSPSWAAPARARRRSPRGCCCGRARSSARASIEQGTTVCDHDPEEIARQTTLGISLAYLTWTGEDGARARDHARRHARPPRLRGRCRHRAGGGGCRRRRGERGRRRHARARVRCGRRPSSAGVPAHRDRDAGGPRASGLPPHRSASCARRSASTCGRSSCPSARSRTSTPSPTCSASTRSSTTTPATTARRRCPPAAEAEEHDLHVSVTEDIVSHDDAQLEAYLDGNEPSAGELERTLAREVATGEAVPVLLCSGVTGTGVDRVADLLCALAPTARDHDSRIVVGGGRGGGWRHRGPRRAEPRRRDGRPRVPHRRRPVRRPDRDAQGAVGHPSAERPAAQRDHGCGRADSGAVPAARSPACARRRAAHRRGRRGREADRLAVRIRALVAPARHRPARAAAAPRAGLRGQPHPGDAVRRREAVDRAGAAARRGPDAPDRPRRRRDDPARARRDPRRRSRSSGSRACSA